MTEVTKPPLERLFEQWEADSEIDGTQPDLALLNIPKLHAKYLKTLASYNLLSKKAEGDLASLRKAKLDYYSGRMTKEELDARGWTQCKLLLKTDVKDYIAGDKDIIDLLAKKANYDEIVSFCQSVMKELTSRTYQLRSYIDWQKFIQGQ